MIAIKSSFFQYFITVSSLFALSVVIALSIIIQYLLPFFKIKQDENVHRSSRMREREREIEREKERERERERKKERERDREREVKGIER